MTELEKAARQALEALESTGLFLHHCWCDVQMNEYSFEKLNKQMEIVDPTITALRQALEQEGRDWSLLEATQESLREHMAEIKRLRSLLEQQPAERLELIGHADLAINNIYIFNGYGEEVPEGRTRIYAGYKHPQPAAWVGLTDEDYPDDGRYCCVNSDFIAGARWAEAKLREKNSPLRTIALQVKGEAT